MVGRLLFLFFIISLVNAESLTRKFDPEKDIEYILYTRKNPTEGQKLFKFDNKSITNSYFDVKKPTKLSTHGFDGNADNMGVTVIRDAILEVLDVNFIALDWSRGVKGPDYYTAYKNTPIAGKSIAEFVDWLVTDFGVDLNETLITGHSLGGQMIGHVGRNLKMGKFGMLIALDPAGPFWTANSSRLNRYDADYVEVVHTNAIEYGLFDALGHNDFYPNGGSQMPGCSIIDVNCHHHRSVLYVGESIRLKGKGFSSVLCNSVAEATKMNCTRAETLPMGGFKPKPEMGVFSLTTNAESPFNRG